MLKNLIFLVSGSTGAQIIAFLALPLITKLYSPASFGAFAFFSSIIWGLVVVGTLQFEHLIIKVTEDDEALQSILSIIASLVLVVMAVLYCCYFTIRFHTRL